MLSPLCLRWLNAGALSQIETEPVVIGGIAQKKDRRDTERVSSRKDGVHQRLADAAPLMIGVHPERPKSQQRLTVDSGAAAYHVSDYFAGSFGDDRELRNDVTVCPKRVDQNGFRRSGFTRPGEGGRVNGEDDILVTGQFASQEHTKQPAGRGRGEKTRAGGGRPVV
jgi:hypothetical protein